MIRPHDMFVKYIRPYKYRDPATGDTWSGKGLQPRWLKTALANGKTLADFDVAATVATPKATLSPAAAWPFPTGADGSGKPLPTVVARAREVLLGMRKSTRASTALAVNEQTLVKGMHIDRSVAARILEQLERDQVVGVQDADGLRNVLIAASATA